MKCFVFFQKTGKLTVHLQEKKAKEGLIVCFSPMYGFEENYKWIVISLPDAIADFRWAASAWSVARTENEY